MPELHPENVAFARLVRAVDPYLADIVVVGGWAHRLFALHELARPAAFLPLTTADADVALPPRLRSKEKSLGSRLEGAGFAEELSGDLRPPVAHYRLTGAATGFYAEFLVAQQGGSSHRDGSRKATVAVAGVTAQRLRYLDLLVASPWTVRLSDAHGFPLGRRGVAVQIPNAARYLLHKILVLGARKGDEQAKDLLYIHDTLAIFSNAFTALRVLATDCLKALPPSTLRKFHRLRHDLFKNVSDPIRLASQIAFETHRPHPPTPQLLLQTSHLGLSEIFSTP